jgi:hypothetical protein
MNLREIREAAKREFRVKQRALYPHHKPDLQKGQIDLGAGCMIKKSSFDNPSAFNIVMYYEVPGRYFNEFGYEVTEAAALEAGFDTPYWKLMKLKKERTEQAMLAIEEEFNPETVTPIAERGGFKVIALSMGRAIVRDPDGNQITPTPVTEAQAMKILSHFVPQEDDDDVIVKTDNKKKE